MPDDSEKMRIHVDSDWKQEAQREKERLSRETRSVGQKRAGRSVSILDIVNMVATQAIVGLGGMASPDGQRIPPDLRLAQQGIDLLDVLLEKTSGNLTEEEAKALSTTLYELRMAYVQLAGPGSMPQAGESPGADERR